VVNVKRDTFRQILTVVAVVATIVVNALANILPFNGQQTGAISDRFAIYFVPAGYVFSIWGLIYLGLIAYAIFQALPAQRENPRLRSIGGLFLVSSVANIAWIFLWHYEVFPATLPVMLVLLGSLIAIYLRLGTGRTSVSRAETWLVRVPFSIYLGWITVATVANATQLLYFLGWNGGAIGPEAWTVVMLAVAVVLAWLMAITRRDVTYLLVLVWAFIGIASKHAGTPVVSSAAWVATVLVAAAVLWSIVARLRRASPTTAA
jgi:benzodiazapine receptor